jgi:hypothetical protein
MCDRATVKTSLTKYNQSLDETNKIILVKMMVNKIVKKNELLLTFPIDQQVLSGVGFRFNKKLELKNETNDYRIFPIPFHRCNSR